MSITPHQHQIMSMYLSGMSGHAIAQHLGLNASGVYAHLRNPVIKAVMAEKLKQLDIQIIDFRTRAIEESHASLEKLVNLRDTAADESLQRHCAKDIIEISGLMPQKRVLIRGDNVGGLTQDSIDFFDEVIAEVIAVTDEAP